MDSENILKLKRKIKFSKLSRLKLKQSRALAKFIQFRAEQIVSRGECCGSQYCMSELAILGGQASDLVRVLYKVRIG